MLVCPTSRIASAAASACDRSREVRALDATFEDAETQCRGEGRRQNHDRQQREGGGGERFPVGGQFPHPGDLHEVGHVVAANLCVGDLEVHAHHVAAEAEEHALAQNQHSAPAPGQPDADGDDREAQELAEQR